MSKRIIATLILIAFIGTSLKPLQAQELSINQLPAPGEMVNLSPAYTPVLIKGLRVHPENPLLFDFILDTGRSGLGINSLGFKIESQKLIKYFLTALTIKEDDLWVNLSPYERNRIIPGELGKTELGRDMLAQDYILKQLTASLIYPERQLGKDFWNTVYAKSQQMFGTADIPVNTFNKVWIVADKANILERNNVGFVVGAHLKVMLEEDYLALAKYQGKPGDMALAVSPSRLPSGSALNVKAHQVNNLTHNLASRIVKQIILPQLEKEVNQGEHFAMLRQMFYSMILASWYKLALKDALLNQVYSNKNKTGGVLCRDPAAKERIYQQYLKAYKRGVFNYIKEDVDSVSKEEIPHKYFSGGLHVLPDPRFIKRERYPKPVERTALLPSGDWAMEAVDMALQATQVIEEPPEMRMVKDLTAIPIYAGRITRLENEGDLSPREKKELQEYRQFLEHRKQRMLDRLSTVALDITHDSRNLYDDLRSALYREYSEFPDEMTVQQFIDQQIDPLVTTTKKQRLLFGFSGTAASGKTTVADIVRDDQIRKRGDAWKIRSVSFDDFLREQEDRNPADTQDPDKKFDVQRFIKFIEDLSNNRYVAKPIYDQKSKGQLKFGLDDDGNVTIFDGKEELVISNWQGSSIHIERFTVKRNSKTGLRESRTQSIERYVLEGEEGKKNLTLGSMPITVQLESNGEGLKIYIKDAEFDFKKGAGGEVVVHMGLEAPQRLEQNKKIEALEAWMPVDLSNPEDREMDFIEGIGILHAVKYFDKTANVNVSSTVRGVRSLIREWIRGNRDLIADTTHAETLTVRTFTEDAHIDALNRGANKEFGSIRRNKNVPQKHFQINNMTLAEQIFRNFIYGRITLGHKILFNAKKLNNKGAEVKLNLDEIVVGIKQAAEEKLAEWVGQVIKANEEKSEVFDNPQAFPGVERLTPEQELRRYWKGSFYTFALGQYLLLKFSAPKPGSEAVGIDAETEFKMKRILSRTQGLVVGASILDLTRENTRFRFLDRQNDNKVTEVALGKVILANQLPYMESVLSELEKRYKESPEKSEQRKAIVEEGEYWVKEFFKVQRQLITVGAVDVAPFMSQRYGEGLSHGRTTVFGVAFGSYRLDQEAQPAINEAIELESNSPYMRNLIESYRTSVPEIGKLEGFQLRFIGNSQYSENSHYSENYLAGIPEFLRPFYIEQVEKFPRNWREFNINDGFGAAWAKAKEEQREGEFENEGITTIPMNFARIKSVSGVVSEHAFHKLTMDFERVMLTRTSNDKNDEESTPRTQWAVAFRSSIQENAFDFLYSMAERFQDHILGNPLWLNDFTASDRSVQKIYDIVHKDLMKQRAEKGETGELVESEWQVRTLKQVIRYAIELPHTWEDFDKQHKRDAEMQSKPKDQALLNPLEHHSITRILRAVTDWRRGGIDLNAKNMAMSVSRIGKGIEMKFNPALIAAFRRGDYSGVTALILRITSFKSVLPILGLPIQ